MWNKKELIGKLRQQRDKFIAEKDEESALIVINRLIEIEPTPKRLCSRGAILFHMGCFVEALQSYQRALLLNPLSKNAQKGIAKVTAKLNKIDHPAGDEGSLIKELEQQQVWQLLQKNWQEAAKVSQKLVTIEPSAIRFCYLGITFIQLEDWPQALVSYQKALEYDKNYLLAHKSIKEINKKLTKETDEILLDKAKKETIAKKITPKWHKQWDTILQSQETELTYKGTHQTLLKPLNTPLPILTFASQAPTKETLKFSQDNTTSDDHLDVASDDKTLNLNVASDDKTLNLNVAPDDETLKSSDTISNNETLKSSDTISNEKVFSNSQSFSQVAKPPVVNNYEFINELARGGMGIVYKGKQRNLKREIALKKLISDSKHNREKFISEALVTAYLDHPNIVPVHELGQNEKNEVLLAMKLVGGTEWKSLLHPKTVLEKERANKYDQQAHLRILLSACNAIAFAHSKGIVHNDLKPSNIMVGEFGEVLVMDWGIALDVGEHCNDERRTFHKSTIQNPMGTPSYMPIELAEGDGENIGFWTDTYLLGAILCEILTGKPPHIGDCIRQVLFSIFQGKLPELNDSIPTELKDICIRALSKDIKNRYQSVAEFQKEVEAFLQHRESIVISDEAQQKLEYCQKFFANSGEQNKESERNKIYSSFAQAVAGFNQALKLWPQNKAALSGEFLARLNYAQIALENGDLGLAEAQAEKLAKNKEVVSLNEKITLAKENKIHLLKNAKRLRYGLAAAMVLVILGLSIVIHREKEQNKVQAKLKSKAQKEEKEAKINLAKIALAKAIEAHAQNKWEHGGALAGISIEFIKNIQGQKANNLKNRGKELVERSLSSYGLIWKTKELSEIISVAFNFDGKIFASCFKDASIKLWDTATQKLLNTLQGHTKEVRSICFHPDGKTLISAGADKTIRLWDIGTGNLRYTFYDKSEINGVSFKRTTVAYASQDGTVGLWDFDTKKNIAKLRGHTSEVRFVIFSSQGRFLASASADGTVRVWDFLHKKTLWILKHPKAVNAISFTPDNAILATACRDEVVRLWSFYNGKMFSKLASHHKAVKSVCFSPDGKILISGSSSQSTFKIWDVATKTLIKTSRRNADDISIAFHPTDKIFISGSRDGSLHLWDVSMMMPTHVMLGHKKEIYSLSFSPDGKTLASGSLDHTIRLWDPTRGKQIKILSGHISSVKSISFSSNSKMIVSASRDRYNDRTAKLWDLTTGKEIGELEPLTERIQSICFSPDDKIIAAGTRKPGIALWDVATRKYLGKLKGHKDGTNSVQFSPNSKILASGSGDNTINLWDTSKKKLLRKLIGHSDNIEGIHFSPNGKILASASRDTTVRLWDVASGKCLKILLGHSASVRSVSFAGNGKILASGSWDKTVRLWNCATGKLIQTLIGHSDRIFSVSFHPNGKFLASASRDTTVRLWDISKVHRFWKNTKFKRESKKLFQQNIDTNPKQITEALFGVKVSETLALKRVNE